MNHSIPPELLRGQRMYIPEPGTSPGEVRLGDTAIVRVDRNPSMEDTA